MRCVLCGPSHGAPRACDQTKAGNASELQHSLAHACRGRILAASGLEADTAFELAADVVRAPVLQHYKRRAIQ